jgi:cytochrome b pre-mRNA-processing protein 3
MPAFFTELGVPDTPMGRYDLIVLHVFLVLRRLRAGGAPGRELAQALFDHMFGDIDLSLREMGVGDLSVGRKVKELAQGFYGRVAAYEEGLARRDATLAAALRRNLYAGGEAAEANLEALEGYVRAEAERMENLPFEELLTGEVRFRPLPQRHAAGLAATTEAS